MATPSPARKRRAISRRARSGAAHIGEARRAEGRVEASHHAAQTTDPRGVLLEVDLGQFALAARHAAAEDRTVHGLGLTVGVIVHPGSRP